MTLLTVPDEQLQIITSPYELFFSFQSLPPPPAPLRSKFFPHSVTII
jgi:hypothetical protein